MGIHPDTLYNRCEQEKGSSFSAYSQEKRSIGDQELHKMQYSVAVKDKNTTMLIFLGKVRLGQRENDQQSAAPREENLDIKDKLYVALQRIHELEQTINDLKPKASEELQRSHSPVQSMDRSGIIGKDLCEP